MGLGIDLRKNTLSSDNKKEKFFLHYLFYSKEKLFAAHQNPSSLSSNHHHLRLLAARSANPLTTLQNPNPSVNPGSVVEAIDVSEVSGSQMEMPDKEEITVKYKNGQISYGNFGNYSLKAMDERVASSTQLTSYWGNLAKLSGERCLVEPLACIEEDGVVITESYGCTLRNSLKTLRQNEGAKWWVKTSHGYRMTPFTQHVFKEIIRGLVTFAKRRIKYQPTLDTIVLDRDEDSPKVRFRCALETTIKTKVTFEPRIIWQALEKLLGHVLKETLQVYPVHPMHPDVHHFKTMLSNDCTAADCTRMIEHPALLTLREVLDFIMQFRDESRRGEVIVTKVKTGTSYIWNSQDGMRDWEEVINKSEHMAAVLKQWEKDTASHTVVNTQPVRLAYFIRNMYQHLNSPQHLEVHERYDYSLLPKYVDDNFPKLAAYLFKCYVIGEGLFVR